MNRKLNSKETIKNDVEKMKGTIKFEVAKELGLLDKIRKHGWKGLTAQETGRVGGIITRRKRKNNK